VLADSCAFKLAIAVFSDPAALACAILLPEIEKERLLLDFAADARPIRHRYREPLFCSPNNVLGEVSLRYLLKQIFSATHELNLVFRRQIYSKLDDPLVEHGYSAFDSDSHGHAVGAAALSVDGPGCRDHARQSARGDRVSARRRGASVNEVPDLGDLVWVDFNPQASHEQSGRRPAMVLSARIYHEKTALAVVCPITSNVAPRHTSFSIPIAICRRRIPMAPTARRAIAALPADRAGRPRDPLRRGSRRPISRAAGMDGRRCGVHDNVARTAADRD